MTVKLYYTSVSSNVEIKKQQQRIMMILDSKKINYESVDIAADSDAKELMRTTTGNPVALPPQIFNGEDYCGDFNAFENAIEEDSLEKFLKL